MFIFNQQQNPLYAKLPYHSKFQIHLPLIQNGLIMKFYSFSKSPKLFLILSLI